MSRTLRVQFFAILVLTVLALCVLLPVPRKPKALSGFRINPGIDLAGGAELRYKVLFEPGHAGDRSGATQGVTDVLHRRVEAKQLKEPKITSSGDDEVIVQLAGIDADGLRDMKQLIGGVGRLQLHAAAPAGLQERFSRNRVVPDGFKAVQPRDSLALLIEAAPVIEGRHILHAEPQQVLESGAVRWVTSFELDAEGAKRFDEAAERLYRQQPRGRIVILLDGQVRSVAAVQSPAFHGRGQISGARE